MEEMRHETSQEIGRLGERVKKLTIELKEKDEEYRLVVGRLEEAVMMKERVVENEKIEHRQKQEQLQQVEH